MKNSLFFLLFFVLNTASGQTQQFSGTWIKLNTTYKFEFQLILNTNKNHQVQGYFIWTVIDYDVHNPQSKEYYEKKINSSAREFVKGTYDPEISEYRIKGYKKEDPFQIIGLDTYHVKIDENGHLGGTTKTGGSWQGRINGEPVTIDLL